MKKAEKKEAASAANVNNKNIARTVLDAETLKHKVQKCTNYNDSRSDARNFNYVEIVGQKFVNEDFNNLEVHGSKFVDCEFQNTKLDHLEGYFSEFENCVFTNCSIENGNFSFATLDVHFVNCNLNGTDFPFAKGALTAAECMMERCSAQNAHLKMTLSNVNAYGFEGNFADFELNISDSNLRSSEFNDGKLVGDISRTDLSRAEMNRSNLQDLHITECADESLQREEAEDFDFGKALDELLEGDDD